MRVSVAMATCNGESFVAEQLASILQQTRPVDEIVVCDDCSADDTLAVVRRALEDFSGQVTLAQNETNLGFKANFKKVLSLCHGDVIFLCDQDDRWLPTKVADTLAFFSEHPTAQVVASSFSLIDGAGEPLPDRTPKGMANQGLVRYFVPSDGVFQPDLVAVLRSNLAPGCALALKRESAVAFCRSSGSVLPHDWELCLIAAGKETLFFYNRVLVEYRLHQHNVLGFKGESTERSEIATQKATALRQLTAYLPVEKEAAFMAKRAEILQQKRKGDYGKLLVSPVYKRFFSLRERLGDLKYLLGK